MNSGHARFGLRKRLRVALGSLTPFAVAGAWGPGGLNEAERLFWRREGRGTIISTMLEYDLYNRPRQRSNPSLVTLASLVLAIVVIGINAWLVRTAALDHSWGALYILIMVGPITNGVIALVTLLSSFLLRWLAGGASVALYIYAGVLLPVVAILVDSACIFCIDLHGC